MSSTESNALDMLLTGENSKLFYQQRATIQARFGHVRAEMEALHTAVKEHQPRIAKLARSAKKRLDPLYDKFDPTGKAGLEDLQQFRFMQLIGGNLINFVSNSNTRLTMIDMFSKALIPALSSKTSAELSNIMLAEESGNELIRTVTQEHVGTVAGFEKLLANIYLSTRGEYKKLKRKFLGGTVTQDNDSVEDQLLMSFFGARPPKRDEATGPAVALIDDNCVLTQLLLDLADNLPGYYEKVVPILKRGKLTGKTETTKSLDNGEIEDFAATLASVANPTYMNYVLNPNEFSKAVLDIVQEFQYEYLSIAEKIEALVTKANLEKDEKRRIIIEDPTALVKQYNRINFLTIRPSAEDIAPRTKLDADVAQANAKVLAYLNETIRQLSTMDFNAQATEDFAVERVKEAIVLRQAVIDIQKTEAQKNLQRNIQDDNEFYVGKSSGHGALSSEREPAPKITYDDVIGESFLKAKKHVEEVVKVASHPNIMRLSAPRGDVRSNLLLIGPYGCGKTEMARAIGSDKRIIGFNVATADLLTAYMHESVKNVKRMYDAAKDLRKNSRYTKPVGILMDEFDRLFNYGAGVNTAYDGARMTGVLQEMMDGISGYEGVFLVGMTNVPKEVPEAILRRFKYVDVVGQLNATERVKLFKMFLTRGLPVETSVTEEDYLKWAEMMNHAPGDVIGKVCDEIHFKFMHEMVMNNPKVIANLEKSLAKKLRDREKNDGDHKYLKAALAKHKIVSAEDITKALETVLAQPQVKMQINKAKQTYRDADEITKGLADINGGIGFDNPRKSHVWGAGS